MDNKQYWTNISSNSITMTKVILCFSTPLTNKMIKIRQSKLLVTTYLPSFYPNLNLMSFSQIHAKLDICLYPTSPWSMQHLWYNLILLSSLCTCLSSTRLMKRQYHQGNPDATRLQNYNSNFPLKAKKYFSESHLMAGNFVG